MGFRYRRGLGIDYETQGYIYFASRCYQRAGPRTKRKIENLCRAAAGENWRALLDYVALGKSATWVSVNHHMDESTIRRATRKYYALFYEDMK